MSKTMNVSENISYVSQSFSDIALNSGVPAVDLSAVELQ